MRPRSVLSMLANLLLFLLVPPFAGTGTAASPTATFAETTGPLPTHFLTGYWHNFDWLLLAYVAAGGAFISALAGPIADAVEQRNILSIVTLSLVGVITTLVTTFLVTYVAEKYVRSRITTPG